MHAKINLRHTSEIKFVHVWVLSDRGKIKFERVWGNIAWARVRKVSARVGDRF